MSDELDQLGIERDLLARTLRPENSPGFLLWQVTNLWQRRQRAALDRLGITHVQFILLAGLAWLQERETTVSQARLAQFCKTDAMMTSQVLRTLERDGLLHRQPDPSDRRARRLTLSSRGAELLNDAMPLVLEADATFFQALTERQGDLIESLRTLWRSAVPSGRGRR